MEDAHVRQHPDVGLRTWALLNYIDRDILARLELLVCERRTLLVFLTQCCLGAHGSLRGSSDQPERPWNLRRCCDSYRSSCWTMFAAAHEVWKDLEVIEGFAERAMTHELNQLSSSHGVRIGYTLYNSFLENLNLTIDSASRHVPSLRAHYSKSWRRQWFQKTACHDSRRKLQSRSAPCSFRSIRFRVIS